VHPFSAFLLAVGILNFSGGILSFVSWFYVKRKYRKKPKLEKEKKVSVIIPCKGEIELENFENQNYKNYEVIVVVDTEQEAYELKERIKNDRLKVEITKKFSECSGKNSALLTGIKRASGDILVFADCDIKPHKNWLSYLVSSLNKNVTTTYRWYFNHPLLAVWNAAIASVFFYKKFNFAWGGSTVIRRRLFEELGIEKIWEREFVDDLTLTKTLKENGVEIKFVPSAIVESREEKDIFKWMNRQFAWIRHYFPSLWKTALFFNIGMRISNIVGFFIIFIHPIIGFLLISPLLFDFVRGWQEYDTFVKLMEYPKEKFISPAYHILLRPLASFIISYNLISSLFAREIEWKGKKYVILKACQQR